MELSSQAGVGIFYGRGPLGLFLGRLGRGGGGAIVVVGGAVGWPLFARCVGQRRGRSVCGIRARDGIEAFFYKLLDGILQHNTPGGLVFGGQDVDFLLLARYACLLLAQVLAAQRSFQGLADLFARDGLEVGGGENVINQGGVALVVVGRHCEASKSRILSATCRDRVAIATATAAATAIAIAIVIAIVASPS